MPAQAAAITGFCLASVMQCMSSGMTSTSSVCHLGSQLRCDQLRQGPLTSMRGLNERTSLSAFSCWSTLGMEMSSTMNCSGSRRSLIGPVYVSSSFFSSWEQGGGSAGSRVSRTQDGLADYTTYQQLCVLLTGVGRILRTASNCSSLSPPSSLLSASRTASLSCKQGTQNNGV